jgi:hypothetical protein
MGKVVHARKKPVTIQAIRTTDAMQAHRDSTGELPVWLSDAIKKGSIVFDEDGVYVTTLEGTMFSGKEDWILCGIKGEIYPCRADIFEQTYDIIA